LSELIKDEAIILRSYSFKETSLILSVVTKKNGKMRLLAKGARRRASSIAGSIRVGSIGEIVYYYKGTRGLQTLREASFSEGFHTDSFERICIFQAVLELADVTMVEGGGDEEAFNLIREAIEALRDAEDPWFVFFTFETGLLKINGIYPDSSKCGRCSVPLSGDVYLNPRSAEFLCSRCRSRGASRISSESFSNMRAMEAGSPLQVKGKRLSLLSRKEIGKVLHYIMLYHVDGYKLPVSLKMLQEVN